MAGIDKIYINKDQYPIFMNWIKSIKKQCARDTRMFIDHYIYKYDQIPEDSQKEFPISNLPEEIDEWILKQNNVPDFIMNRIKEQYGLI